MGVSLQIYRIRIGTYLPKYSIGTSRTNQGNSVSKDCRTSILVLLLCGSLLILSDFNLAPSLSLQNQNRYPILEIHCPPASSSPSCTSPPCPSGTRSSTTCVGPSGITKTPSSWLTRQERNSKIKAENGNRDQSGRGIKILAWNKGSSFLQNKHPEIESIIAGHQPHILGLCEANFMKNTDPRLVQHENYILHTAPTLDNPALGVSRVVVYTHSSLIVKRRPDLEDSTLSAIWLEVGMPRQKKILVCNIYREWQYMGQGPGSQSGSVTAQLRRWLVFLDKWEAALREDREVIVLGDINLDFLKWGRNLPASDSNTRLKGLTDSLFARIFPLGVSQLVRTATRFAPNSEPSGLDHIYI